MKLELKAMSRGDHSGHKEHYESAPLVHDRSLLKPLSRSGGGFQPRASKFLLFVLLGLFGLSLLHHRNWLEWREVGAECR